MTLLSRLGVSALLCSLWACTYAGASTSEAGGGERELALAVGESAALGECRIGLVRLVADSRCPEGMTCVWAGDAEVELELSCSGNSHELRLHTNLEPREAEIEGWHVELLAVDPAPRADTAQDASAVRVRLMVAPVE